MTPADLGNPAALYAELGCKTVVGLPFKDISTTDTLLLRSVPAVDDATARQTIKRLQDVAIHMLVPAAELEREPLEGAVALQTLDEALTGSLPACAARRVIALRGDETSEQVAKLKSTDHAFIMLDVPPELSRIHASRRVFALLKEQQIDSAVIHHWRLPPSDKSELALQLGAQVGGLLCDGLRSSSRRRALTSTWS